MADEILINVNSGETRVALLEGGLLVELYIERTSEQGITGNIYKGRVVRVLPGMQAAFVDIGLEKAAFLYGTDLWFFGQARISTGDSQIYTLTCSLYEHTKQFLLF